MFMRVASPVGALGQMYSASDVDVMSIESDLSFYVSEMLTGKIRPSLFLLSATFTSCKTGKYLLKYVSSARR